jgi:hypothetical protein
MDVELTPLFGALVLIFMLSVIAISTLGSIAIVRVWMAE